eukprot:1266280-Amphidinium_carterae.1
MEQVMQTEHIFYKWFHSDMVQVMCELGTVSVFELKRACAAFQLSKIESLLTANLASPFSNRWCIHRWDGLSESWPCCAPLRISRPHVGSAGR